MAKPYVDEMARLSETLAWASQTDISALRKAVAVASLGPLVAVGSGGSLSAAHALAFLHRRLTGQLASIATPLEAAGEHLQRTVSTWLLSAGGDNVDILTGFRALVSREARQLAALCGRSDSPLAALARAHPFVDLILHEPPAGRDGFLTTNSLLAFAALLTRAYAEALPGQGSVWEVVYELLAPLAKCDGPVQASWKQATETLWQRSTTVVLYGAGTRIGAIDLESKFTEAAIGNLQLADWRNFAHGRHHWFAKRGETSAILALISREDESLAERTLALIPSDIPIARIPLDGPPIATSLASLVAALCIVGWAGAARGLDPGRPGVPEFGRRLYNLHLTKPHRRSSTGLSKLDAAAITRKAGVPPEALASRGELNTWQTVLQEFRTRLTQATYAGLVLDYDGTIVDTRRRFSGPEPQVVDHLVRLGRAGAHLAIATGRGRSIRRDLKAALPSDLWSQVLVGYYNGAEIALLEDDSAPCRVGVLCEALADLSKALRAQPELAAAADQTDRPRQITLEPRCVLPEDRLWDLAQQVILSTGIDEVTVTRSSHSIDIVPKGTSKRSVLDRLRATAGPRPFLTIGDRGRWPGNDYDLLQEPCALSVDEVSVDPVTCWNLGSPGQRGVQVLLEYLQQLQAGPGGMHYGKPSRA